MKKLYAVAAIIAAMLLSSTDAHATPSRPTTDKRIYGYYEDPIITFCIPHDAEIVVLGHADLDFHQSWGLWYGNLTTGCHSVVWEVAGRPIIGRWEIAACDDEACSDTTALWRTYDPSAL